MPQGNFTRDDPKSCTSVQLRCSLKSINKGCWDCVQFVINHVLSEHLDFHMTAHPGLYHNIKNHASDGASAVTSVAPGPGACFYTAMQV